jgi:hypothetical protein
VKFLCPYYYCHFSVLLFLMRLISTGRLAVTFCCPKQLTPSIANASTCVPVAALEHGSKFQHCYKCFAVTVTSAVGGGVACGGVVAAREGAVSSWHCSNEVQIQTPEPIVNCSGQWRCLSLHAAAAAAHHRSHGASH